MTMKSWQIPRVLVVLIIFSAFLQHKTFAEEDLYSATFQGIAEIQADSIDSIMVDISSFDIESPLCVSIERYNYGAFREIRDTICIVEHEAIKVFLKMFHDLTSYKNEFTFDTRAKLTFIYKNGLREDAYLSFFFIYYNGVAYLIDDRIRLSIGLMNKKRL